MITKATKQDFFPEELFPDGVSFLYPDHMARLSGYATRLSIENAEQGLATGERIPASAITARLMSEFDLTMEQVHEFRLIGNYVAYDRELRDLTAEQLRQREIDDTPTDEQIAEARELTGGTLDDFVLEIIEENERFAKVDEFLNDLFGKLGE